MENEQNEEIKKKAQNRAKYLYEVYMRLQELGMPYSHALKVVSREAGRDEEG